MNKTTTSLLVNGSIIFVLCLSIFYVSTWWRLNTQFALGEEAQRKGKFAEAVAGYESALHMYIPGNETIDKAARQLWSIGQENERLGDISRALVAYRALRSSYYSAHWLVTPGKEWIERCDARIATLINKNQKER